MTKPDILGENGIKEIKSEIDRLVAALEDEQLSVEDKADLIYTLMPCYGKLIDPEKAILIVTTIDISDPYGTGDTVNECFGKGYFARNPDGPMVYSRHIPKKIWEHILSKAKREEEEAKTHCGRVASEMQRGPILHID